MGKGAKVWVGMVAITLVLGGGMAAAQAPVRAPGDVEVDPIKCWWKTDKSTVQVGERFTLTLTCGIVETERIKVVPEANQLEATAVQLAPFEVVSGRANQDVMSPPWRYLQREYVVRLMGDAFFGKDIDIPALKVTYRIQSSIGGGSQGRDQTYILPALPMRVASLVPKKAADIRDASRETFADIEARRGWAAGAMVAAAICFGFAAVLAGLGVVRFAARFRVRTPAAARPLPLGRVLNGCLGAMAQVRADVSRDGWTTDLAARAIAALRIAGAVALGKPVAQAIVDKRTAGHAGQLVLRKGVVRQRRALVSTPTTPATIAKALGPGDADALGSRTHAILTEIQEALGAFGTARYGRDGRLDATTLDAALEQGTSAIRRLRSATRWPMRTAGAIARTATDIRGVAWSR